MSSSSSSSSAGITFPNIMMTTSNMKGKRKGNLVIDEKNNLSFVVPLAPNSPKDAKPKETKIPREDIRSGLFLQSFSGFQFHLQLKNDYKVKLSGFREEHFRHLENFMRIIDKDMKRGVVATKGANFGEFLFTSNGFSFYVEKNFSFEVSSANIARIDTPGKQEVTVEFKDEEKNATTNQILDTQLYEMRVWVPAPEEKEDGENDENEERKEKKSEDDMDEDGETDSTTPAMKFMQKFPIIESSLSTAAITVFRDVKAEYPRCQAIIELYSDAFKFSNESMNIRIIYDQIQRIFLLENKLEYCYHLLLQLSEPFRRGQTSYSFVLLRLYMRPEDDDNSSALIEQKLNLDEQQLKEKYGQALTNPVTGEPHEVFTRIFKNIMKKPIFICASSEDVGFRSKKGARCVQANYKTDRGYLYLCEKSFVYVKKPPLYISHKEVAHVEFARVSSADSSRSTFDLNLTLKDANEKVMEFTFGSIGLEEYEHILRFLKSTKLQILDVGALSDRVASVANRNKQIDYSEDTYLKKIDQAIADEEGDDDEDDEEDEDYEAGGSDEDGGSDAGEEGSGNEEDLGEEVEEDGMELSGTKQPKKPKASSSSSSDSGKKKKKEKVEKKRNLPKKAITAFLYFLSAKRKEFQATHPELKMTEISKGLSEKWRALTAEEKIPYEKQAAEDKKRYEEEKTKMEIEEPTEEKEDDDNTVASSSSGKKKKGKKGKEAKEGKKDKKFRKVRPFRLFSDDFKASADAAFNSKSKEEQKAIIKDKFRALPDAKRKEYKEKSKILKANIRKKDKGEKGTKRKRKEKADKQDDAGDDMDEEKKSIKKEEDDMKIERKD